MAHQSRHQSRQASAQFMHTDTVKHVIDSFLTDDADDEVLMEALEIAEKVNTTEFEYNKFRGARSLNVDDGDSFYSLTKDEIATVVGFVESSRDEEACAATYTSLEVMLKDIHEVEVSSPKVNRSPPLAI